jgi:hypothetical protein
MVLTSDGVDRWALTCRHVLARRDGTIAAADRLFQPDAAHGAIATLAGLLGDVGLDCAAVRLDVAASAEILGIGTPAACRAPMVGMRVVKSGWKTGVSEGRIQQVNGNDVVVEPLAGYPVEYLLAAQGDSGAVWMEARSLAPVALHARASAVGPPLAFGTSILAILGVLGVRQL